MTTENKIAYQLVKGSNNIDRMRNEIRMVVKMVVGFSLITDGASRVTIDEVFESETCMWGVTGNVGSIDSNQNRIEIECMVKMKVGGVRTKGGSVGYTLITTRGDDWFPAGVDTVQDVHADLSTFVNGMIKTLPYLAKHLEPLLKAADAF